LQTINSKELNQFSICEEMKAFYVVLNHRCIEALLRTHMKKLLTLSSNNGRALWTEKSFLLNFALSMMGIVIKIIMNSLVRVESWVKLSWDDERRLMKEREKNLEGNSSSVFMCVVVKHFHVNINHLLLSSSHMSANFQNSSEQTFP
jgi:hypothetical protein